MTKGRALLMLQLQSYQLRCVRFLAGGQEPPPANIDELAELGADLAALEEESERN